MIEAGIPVVRVDRIPEEVTMDSISVEDISAAEMGVDHLIAMGYRRIAIVTGPVSLKNEQRRLLGYVESLKRAQIRRLDSLVWHGNLRPEDVEVMCRDHLSDAPNLPDPISCTN